MKLNPNRAMLKALEKNANGGQGAKRQVSNSSTGGGLKTNGLTESALNAAAVSGLPPGLPPPHMNYYAGDVNSNGNALPLYQHLLPKYDEYNLNAMNAALLATFPNPCFYGLGLDPRLSPYNNLQRLLEITAVGQQQQQREHQQEEQQRSVANAENEQGHSEKHQVKIAEEHSTRIDDSNDEEEVNEEETPDESKLVMDLDESDAIEEGNENVDDREGEGEREDNEDNEPIQVTKETDEHSNHNEDEATCDKLQAEDNNLATKPSTEEQVANVEATAEVIEHDGAPQIKIEQSRPSTPAEEEIVEDQEGVVQLEALPTIKQELDQSGEMEEAQPRETISTPTSAVGKTNEQINSDTPFNSTELRCSRCSIQFNHHTELVQHEKVLCGFIKQELQQQQYQEPATTPVQRERQQLDEEPPQSLETQHNTDEATEQNASLLHSSDAEDYPDERDSNSRNDCNSEGSERKVRVRTAITEEQQQQLKQHYAINARPSREEFRMIAARLQLDARVVQVWFQNNRSRERKMQSYQQQQTNGNKVPFTMGVSELATVNNVERKAAPAGGARTGDEQPLDLSLKRDWPLALKRNGVQQQHSPLYGIAPMQNVNGSDLNEAINLSRKMSASMSPPSSLSPSSAASVPQSLKQQAAFYFGAPPSGHHFQRQTPSPSEAPPLPQQQPLAPRNGDNNHQNSFSASLAGHLPPYMLPAGTQRGLMPMDAIFRMTPGDYACNPLINSIKFPDYRGTSLSPGGSEKRSWRDDDSRISHEDDYIANGLLPKPKRPKAETHGHAGDPDLPFICDQCDKAFAKQSSLARHKYEHSGEHMSH